VKHIGYSTGAIALGDFDRALGLLSSGIFDAVELSALRTAEVRPLVEAIPRLNLRSYSYISFHAPSKFDQSEEKELVELLSLLPSAWPIVVHPDAIFDFSLWSRLGSRIAIENMDKRKPIGRTCSEMTQIFERLPNAKMCFDVGHARQFDASMAEAFLMLTRFKNKIVQIHVSEVDTANRHDKISFAAEIAFKQVARFIPKYVPLILESRVEENQILSEATKTWNIFGAGQA
jgi:hypothetical protein